MLSSKLLIFRNAIPEDSMRFLTGKLHFCRCRIRLSKRAGVRGPNLDDELGGYGLASLVAAFTALAHLVARDRVRQALGHDGVLLRIRGRNHGRAVIRSLGCIL